MEVKIIDTHVHSWNLQKAKPNWLTEEAGILYDEFLPEHLQNQLPVIGVKEGILVQSDNTLADTIFMFEKAREVNWIKGVVAWLPLADPEQTFKLITEQYKKEPYFKGVRHLMHIEPDDQWLLQDRVMESLQLLAQHQIPFDGIGINLNQLDSIISAAEKMPGLQIVIDHLNQPPMGDALQFRHWSDKMKVATELPNLYVKVSGLGNIKRPEGFDLEEAIKPALDVVLNYFGNQRIFCGGDWPISLLDRDYATTWKAYINAFSFFIKDNNLLEEITYWNAKRFYQIN